MGSRETESVSVRNMYVEANKGAKARKETEEWSNSSNKNKTKWTKKEALERVSEVSVFGPELRIRMVKKVYEELKMNESLYVRKYRAFKKCVVQ
jgi:hypothetical protein